MSAPVLDLGVRGLDMVAKGKRLLAQSLLFSRHRVSDESNATLDNGSGCLCVARFSAKIISDNAI